VDSNESDEGANEVCSGAGTNRKGARINMAELGRTFGVSRATELEDLIVAATRSIRDRVRANFMRGLRNESRQARSERERDEQAARAPWHDDDDALRSAAAARLSR
jgi:hypothetical protein